MRALWLVLCNNARIVFIVSNYNARIDTETNYNARTGIVYFFRTITMRALIRCSDHNARIDT